MMAVGRVYIVGAGPGAPELISVRGFRALLAADAVLIDRLLPSTFLEELGLSAAGRTVRWLGGDPSRMSQSEINAWLVSQAGAGRIVVRLKGGDPFVFARGEEEVAALSEAGIPWEVIPGASAATAVPTASGFPLTRHGLGRSFAVATAKIAGGAIAEMFPRADSLVILMGTASLEFVTARLMADGWSPKTPAAAIESGTAAWERRAEGHLDDIYEKATQVGLSAPATLIIGEAASHCRAARQRPTVLFTGLDPSGFHWLGNLLHWPAVQWQEDPAGQASLVAAVIRLADHGFDWLVLGDKQAANALLSQLHAQGCDARCLARTRLAAMPAAALRLKEFGLLPDAVGDARSLVRAACIKAGNFVLALYGTHAPHLLVSSLTASGADVTSVQVGRLVPHTQLGRPLPEHDVVYFVSPAAVRAYWSVYGPTTFDRPVWCMGEQTQQMLEQLGVASAIIASPDDLPRMSAG
jgi:uroporphyrin-III C-methyltransferase